MPFDGTQLNETAQHLLRAKQYLLDHGWCSYGAEGDNGTVCVAMAMWRAGKGGRSAKGVDAGRCAETANIFVRAIGHPKVEMPGILIGGWNDTPGRTLDEVLATFDRAIALAMAEGE